MDAARGVAPAADTLAGFAAERPTAFEIPRTGRHHSLPRDGRARVRAHSRHLSLYRGWS